MKKSFLTPLLVLFAVGSAAVLHGAPAVAAGQAEDKTPTADSIAAPRGSVIDEVVWVVGDEAILKSDIEQMRLQAAQEGIRFKGNPDCAIPEQIAVQKLFLHQAAIDSIEVTESDIAAGSDQQKMQQKLVENIKVTPAEVRRHFRDIPQDSLPFVPTEVEVQIITQTPPIDITEINRVKDQLREFTDRINKGEASFSTLARLYSQDGSARNGGELGYTGRGQWVPEFANVAFNLTDPKKVSKIVETEFGFHIIQLIDKRGDKVNARA